MVKVCTIMLFLFFFSSHLLCEFSLFHESVSSLSSYLAYMYRDIYVYVCVYVHLGITHADDVIVLRAVSVF